MISHIAVGRRMNRSATSAATIEKALSQPNSRGDGRSENTVTTRPQASTTVVRISAGTNQHSRALDGDRGIGARRVFQTQAVEEVDRRR